MFLFVSLGYIGIKSDLGIKGCCWREKKIQEDTDVYIKGRAL